MCRIYSPLSFSYDKFSLELRGCIIELLESQLEESFLSKEAQYEDSNSFEETS